MYNYVCYKIYKGTKFAIFFFVISICSNIKLTLFDDIIICLFLYAFVCDINK